MKLVPERPLSDLRTAALSTVAMRLGEAVILALVMLLLLTLLGKQAQAGQVAAARRGRPEQQPPSASTPQASTPITVYVDANHEGVETGTRQQPWRTFARAMNAAQPGATILAAGGVYSENLAIGKNLNLAGGYAPASSPISWTVDSSGPATIINGRRLDSVIVVNAGVTAHLRGVTLTNGRASSGGGLRSEGAVVTLDGVTLVDNQATGGVGRGGGLYAERSAVTIRGSQVLDNRATDWGGGLFIQRSYAAISSTVITTNTVFGGGGGLYADQAIVDLSYSRILSNTADCCGGGVGGELAQLMLHHNQISYNRVDPASALGGGFFASQATATLNANTVTHNQAMAGAGLVSGSGSYLFTNNLVAANRGGGMILQTGSVINNTLRDNRGNDYDEFGEGILVSGAAAATRIDIVNNIIISNTIGIGMMGAGADPTLVHNDVWGNVLSNYVDVAPGATDIAIDPALAGGETGYHLLPGSPCIDAGEAAGAPNSDMEDDLRPQDGDVDGVAAVDIGADEFENPTLTPTPTATALPVPVYWFPLFLRESPLRLGG